MQLWTVDYLKLSGVFNLTLDSSFPACFHPPGTRAPPLRVNSAELLTSSRSVSLCPCSDWHSEGCPCAWSCGHRWLRGLCWDFTWLSEGESASPLPGHDGREPLYAHERTTPMGSVSYWRLSSGSFFLSLSAAKLSSKTLTFLLLCPALPGLWDVPGHGCGFCCHQPYFWHSQGRRWSAGITKPCTGAQPQPLPQACEESLKLTMCEPVLRQEQCPACHPQNPSLPWHPLGHERSLQACLSPKLSVAQTQLHL